ENPVKCNPGVTKGARQRLGDQAEARTHDKTTSSIQKSQAEAGSVRRKSAVFVQRHDTQDNTSPTDSNDCSARVHDNGEPREYDDAPGPVVHTARDRGIRACRQPPASKAMHHEMTRVCMMRPYSRRLAQAAAHLEDTPTRQEWPYAHTSTGDYIPYEVIKAAQDALITPVLQSALERSGVKEH
ncbi:hypothetical protein BDV93DRAFT_517027, partial [Ceratobasidium sp. AG-I]